MRSEISNVIEAAGVIVERDGQFAVVEIASSGCGRCHEAGGCGGNNIGQMFCASERTFRVRNDADLPVGARVTVAVARNVVRQSALSAYVFPLALLFLGALCGSLVYGEIGAIVGAAVALVFSWGGLVVMQQKVRLRHSSKPYIKLGGGH